MRIFPLSLLSSSHHGIYFFPPEMLRQCVICLGRFHSELGISCSNLEVTHYICSRDFQIYSQHFVDLAKHDPAAFNTEKCRLYCPMHTLSQRNPSAVPPSYMNCQSEAFSADQIENAANREIADACMEIEVQFKGLHRSHWTGRVLHSTTTATHRRPVRRLPPDAAAGDQPLRPLNRSRRTLPATAGAEAGLHNAAALPHARERRAQRSLRQRTALRILSSNPKLEPAEPPGGGGDGGGNSCAECLAALGVEDGGCGGARFIGLFRGYCCRVRSLSSRRGFHL